MHWIDRRMGLMKKDTESLISELERINNRAEKALDKLIQASENADSRESSTLFGTAGGILGALAGILIAPHIALPVLLISTPLTALGIIGGILIYRGRDGIKLEKMIAKNRRLCNEVLNRINSLPEDTPQSVIDNLWEHYNRLNGVIGHQSAIALSQETSKKKGIIMSDGTE